MQLEMEAFHAALDRPVAERTTYLQQQFGGDPGFVDRVLRLLEAHAEVEREGLSAEERFVPPMADPLVGRSIGPYRVVERIGAGGMGVVYEAEQEAPIRRRVALKLLKLGMDTEEILQRFEAERHAMARMDHPGIARILDAGATDDGRPYFAMELVEGRPIREYCASEELPLSERLRLFARVCSAVQHAHQRGVIHRDLKPSNVLVARRDGSAHPKVIDFGIAKATAESLTDGSDATQLGRIVGTPDYMSPEQASAEGPGVDVRSDVYSLGVMLYELVARTRPFDGPSAESETPAARAVRLRDATPPRPSARIADESALPGLTDRDRAALARAVRGDLDWVVLRAIDQDPERRYPSAQSFEDDLVRYLEDRPVTARPPSALYVARKFVRRHRVLTALAAAAAVSLLVGVGGLAAGLVRANRAEALAVRRAEASQAAAEFLQKVLFQVDPEFGSASLTIAEVLENASTWIADELGDYPTVEASTQDSIGVTFRRRSLYAEAEPHLVRALALREEHLGPDHVDTAASHVALASLRFERDGAFDMSLDHLATAREILEQHGLEGGRPGAWLDLDTGLILLAADRLDEAESALGRCLDAMRRELGPTHPDVSRPLRALAHAAFLRGDIERAGDLSRESLTVAARHDVGYLIARGQLVRAEV
ncbi:MAG: serine/threonine-protein kinase, partial [Planctomycetota bacterium]